MCSSDLEAEKVQQKKEQKQKEDELRAEQEQDTEKPDAGEEDEETPRPLLPKMSFLDKIKDFLGKVIIGWFTFRLLKFLPRVIGIVKVIGRIADFVIWFGGKILDGLITMVHSTIIKFKNYTLRNTTFFRKAILRCWH